MKKYLLLGTMLSFSSFATAASLENLGCYSGPLYRALVGQSVLVSADGTKSIEHEGNVLIQCAMGGNQCSAKYNHYSCTVNFKSLEGSAANKVYVALGGRSVQIAEENANSDKCEYMHCTEVTEVSCASLVKCSVDSYITGWNE
ncbi:MAG: hypothetical protein ACXVCP_19970 [Bdellovibrio sp.]